MPESRRALIWSFIKANLDWLGGGALFGVLGIVGLKVDNRIELVVSLVGISGVALQRVIRALNANRLLNRDFNAIVGCFRKCITRKTAGMTIGHATITYRIDSAGRNDSQERRYELRTGNQGAATKHVFIGSYHDGTEYGQGFKPSLVRSLGLKAEDVTPLREGDDFRPLSVCAVPYTVDKKNLYVALGFDPMMSPNETREIKVHVHRKGLWDELRATGRDEDCSYKVSGIPTDLLRIQIMLEGDNIDASPGKLRIIPEADSLPGTTVRSEHNDAAGRTVAIWNIPNPTPGRAYRYTVECDPMKPPDRIRGKRLLAAMKRILHRESET